MVEVHAFDIDGTITTNKKLLEAIQTEYPAFTYEGFLHYSIEDSLKHQNLLTETCTHSNGRFFGKHGENIFYQAELHEGVIDYITDILLSGHKVIFVTARPQEEYLATRKWLNAQGFIDIPLYCVGSKSKNDVLHHQAVTHFYEDSVENACAAITVPTIKKIYIIDAPYNQHGLPNQVVRVHNWQNLK